MKAPPFPISPGTELSINGHLQVISELDCVTGKVELLCPVRNTRITLALQELVHLRMDGAVKLLGAAPPVEPPPCPPVLGDLSRPDYQRVARRGSYGRSASKLYPVGPHSSRLEADIAEVAVRINDKHPPSAHSVYRWMRRYVTAGYNSAVFMQDLDVVRTRTARVDPRAKLVLKGHIEKLLASYTHATLHGVTDLALALTAKDLGHLTFITKNGTESLVDEFIPVAEHQIKHPHRPRRPRGASKQRPSKGRKSTSPTKEST